MGAMVALECSECGLRGQDLLRYSGFAGLEYTPAWCGTCGKCVSAHIEGGWRVDRSRLRRCPCCSGEVSLFDMENPICPICGTVMEVSYTSLWD
ncbi:MAG: hypothetical protein ACOZCF_09635 [Bacillota bacterium]